MSGEWIKLEVGLPEKPEVMRLAKILKSNRLEVLGLLMRFWVWVDRNTVDGVVDAVEADDVDEVVGRQGFAQALCEVNWLSVDAESRCINVPKFDRHNGESAKKRALKNERQARWRAKSVVSNVDASTSTQTSTREEKRRIKTTGGDRSPSKSTATPQWWATQDATLEEAKRLGISTRGESWDSLKNQIKQKRAA